MILWPTSPLVASRMVWNKVYGSDFVRKVGETFGTRFFLIIVGTGTGIVIARALGPEGRGTLAVMVSISTIGMQFGNLGLHAANTYHVAKDGSLLGTLLGNSLLAAAVLGGLVSVGILSVLVLWPGAPLRSALLALPLVAVPLGLAAMHGKNLLLGIQQVHRYNQLEVIQGVLRLGLVGTLVIVGTASAGAVYGIDMIMLAVGLGAAMVSLRPHMLSSIRCSLSLLHQCLGYAWKAYLSSVFSILIRRVDILMVSHYLGSAETGHYAIAVNYIAMMSLFPEVVGTIAFPKLCEMRSWQERMRFTNRATVLVLGVMIPLVVVAVLTAEWLIGLLYGESFVPAAGPLVWFLPGVLVLSVEVMYRRILISEGYPVVIVWGWAAAFLFNILLNTLLIPRQGLNGAAVASSVAYLVVSAATVLLYALRPHARMKGRA